MISGILIAAAIVGGTGLFIGVFLGVSGKKFAVEVDEREEAILAELPGNNCGGCGYAGCSVYFEEPFWIGVFEQSCETFCKGEDSGRCFKILW